MELVKTKSVVVQEADTLHLTTDNLPALQPGEARIKVQFASICGSDIHIWHGHNPFAKYPRVIGHEFCGIIDDVYEASQQHRVGQFVVIDPVVSCGNCYPCRIGRPNVCKTLQVIGVHRDGGFSQYANVPLKNAYLAPRSVSPELCSLVEPYTIAANITAFLKPTPQDCALIYGAGPMGLTAVQVLKNVYQVAEVIVVDRIAERLVRAKDNGADYVFNNLQQPLNEHLAGKQPTLVIDGACHPSILAEAVQVISPAGRIGLLGFSQDPCTVTQQSLTSKELSIFTSRLNSSRFPQVIEWFEQGLVQPEKLVTDRFALQDAEQAMHRFETAVKHSCKVLLSMDE